MGRGGTRVVIYTVLLFVGVIAAGAVGAAQPTIHSPTDKTYTDDGSVTVHITASDPYDVQNFSIPTVDVYTTFSGGRTPQFVGDGNHRILAWATDGNTTERASTDFTIDTSGPVVEYIGPDGQTYDRDVDVLFQYDDAVSSVDRESVAVTMDGNPVNASNNDLDSRFQQTFESFDEGNHTVAITVADSHGHTTEQSWDFTLPRKPILSGAGPNGLVDGDDPTLTVTAKDPSGISVNTSYIKLKRDGTTVNEIDGKTLRTGLESTENGVTINHGLEDLEDGEYTAEAYIYDASEAEHVATTSWTFTVDTTPPTVDVLSHSSGDLVTGEQQFVASAEDVTGTVEDLTFALGDHRVTADAGSGTEFQQYIDTEKAADGDTTLHVAATDDAGNTATTEINLTVDNTAPDAAMVDLYPRTVSSALQVSAVFSDAVTKIRDAEFLVRNTSLQGTMSPVDSRFNSTREEFRRNVDVTSLEPGNHILYVRAKDDAGHWNQRVGRSFTVDENVSAAFTVEHRDRDTVITGNDLSFTLQVRNDGNGNDIARVTADGDIAASVQPARKRVHAGETKTFDVTLDTADAALGLHQVEFTVNGLSDTTVHTLDVIVQPPEARQQAIESRFNALDTRFDELQASKNDYDDRVNDPEAQSTFAETAETLQQISELLEAGRYHRAAELLDDAEAGVSESKTTVTGMVHQYRMNTAKSIGLKLLAFLLVAGVVFSVYRRLPPAETGYNPEHGYVHRDDDDKHPVQVLYEEWREQAQEYVDRLTGNATEAATGATEQSSPHEVRSWKGYSDKR